MTINSRSELIAALPELFRVEDCDEHFTELDREILFMAIGKPGEYRQLLDNRSLVEAKTCILRKKGRTLSQIATKLKVPKTTIQGTCSKC